MQYAATPHHFIVLHVDVFWGNPQNSLSFEEAANYFFSILSCPKNQGEIFNLSIHQVIAKQPKTVSTSVNRAKQIPVGSNINSGRYILSSKIEIHLYAIAKLKQNKLQMQNYRHEISRLHL